MKPVKTLLSLLLLTGVASTWMPAPAPAQELSASTDSTWELQLNLHKIFASRLGEMLLQVVQEEKPEKLAAMDEFVDALGFDPRHDVQQIIVFGDGFEETSPTALVNIGKSRGNLEGWILAAPGYQSEELPGEVLLHSFLIEKRRPQRNNDGMKFSERLWCALPFSEQEEAFVVVASFDRDKTVHLVDTVLDQGLGQFGNRLEGNKILSLSVNDFSEVPIEIDQNEPGSAIIKTVQSVTMDASSDSDRLTANCEITTFSPPRARQLHQLLTGLKAMVQLSANSEDLEAQKAGEIMKNLQVNYTEGETHVTANYSIGYDVISELICLKHTATPASKALSSPDSESSQ